jgi:monoamine oxidase
MKRLSRRLFLAASAALTAVPVLNAPALGAPAEKKKAAPRSQEPRALPPEVVIVGAGAAGIAAARRLSAANRRVVLLEATGHVGGRCITDTTTFGVPYDRGAHAIHMPDINPLAKLATGSGLDIYPAPPGQRVRIGRRYARESEMEDLFATLVRAKSAIADAARKGDVACSQALPKDLGEWRATVDFILGPYGCAKDLTDISAVDFVRSAERDIDAFCRQGLGTLLVRLAAGLPVQLSTPVTRIGWAGRGGVEVETAQGKIEARAAIVTVSTDLLVSGKIRFTPDLPKRQLDAAARLKLGSYDHVMLELSDNPLGLRADELVFEKSNDQRTASLFANVSGSSLCMIDVAGSFGRELSAKGERAMAAFAVDWLAGLYGNDIKRAVKRVHATRWNDDPWTLGAFSAAAPGGQPARRILMEPLGNGVWFAGEAAHELLWGTVGGAWESGERAADAALKMLGARR